MTCQALHTFGRYTACMRDEFMYLDKLKKKTCLKIEKLGPKMRINNVNSMANSGLHNKCPMSLSVVRGTKVLRSDELLISNRYRTNLNSRLAISG